MQQFAQEAAVLVQQWLIQAQLGPQRSAGAFGSAGAEQGVDRIPRRQPQQQKNQAGDQPQHQWRQRQPGGQVAQKGPAAAHGLVLPWGVCLRVNSCSNRRPEPSKRGWLMLAWAQARGATSHTGR